MNLDPTQTALIVVDMQNGFCHSDGSLYAPASEAVIDPITSLISAAETAGASIVFTKDEHPVNQFSDTHYYDEFDRWGKHVIEGTWDAEFVDELNPAQADLIVIKHTYDAFYETQLDGWLTAHNISDLVICGTLANVCVLHTAGSAGLRDYRPVLVSDAVGSIEAAHREYVLNHANWLFGEVYDSAEIEFN